MAKTVKAKAPWKRPNPRKRAGKASRHLSPAKKSAAKARAKRAGRPYPNLVDNMRMAKSAKKKTAKKPAKKAVKKTIKKTAKQAAKKSGKKSARKKSGKAAEKDPKGGLTAAGRKAFARKDGADLKPGVRKKTSEMTPTDMRRKGSWAVRFYGRAKLPPLVDARGEPTRLALSAHAWGEKVPKTEKAARKIAAKGEKLLARYRKAREKANETTRAKR
ncbi:MAG: DUF6321 domain-containing protein [Tardiphaga sp.]